MANKWSDMTGDEAAELLREFPGRKPVALLRITAGFALSRTVVLLFDDPEENVYFEAFSPSSLNSNRDTNGLRTIPYDEVLKLKKLAESPDMWLEQEDCGGYMRESGIVVMDGQDEEITVFRGEERSTYLYSNLAAYKKYLKNYPQAKAALTLMERLLKAVRKYTGVTYI